jgi:hypothetical protein
LRALASQLLLQECLLLAGGSRAGGSLIRVQGLIDNAYCNLLLEALSPILSVPQR